MRFIFISLLVVILSAVIGLGLLFDWYYLKTQNNNDEPLSHISRHTLSQIIQDYASLIAANPELLNKLDNAIIGGGNIRIELDDRADFPLPEEMQHTFKSSDLFALNSQDQVSVHSYQKEIDKVLSFYIKNDLLHTPPQASLDNRGMFLTLLYYSGLVIFICIWLVPLVRRIYRLNFAIKQFGEGRIESRVEESSFSYIANIEYGFNKMAQRIEDLITDNKLLSRAVSHDLRTPIASLRFGMEMLAETTNNDAQQQYIKRMNRDLDSMEDLVENLIAFARLEQADIPLSLEPVEFNQHIDDYLANVDTNKKIVFDKRSEKAWLKADIRYLKMMIDNIVLNACKYANSAIALKVIKHENFIEFVVEDDGPGIASNEFQQVLKPFYQINSSHKGHGMGLAIVNRIAAWLNADLSLAKSAALGGLSVRIRFYV